jgi:hypothetical protein
MGRPVGLLLFVLSFAGCGPGGSGGSGDPRSEPNPDVLGNGARISDLMVPRFEVISDPDPDVTWLEPANEDSVACAGIPLDQATLVTGVVVTHIDDFDETGSGAVDNIYVQDAVDSPGPNSGMTVFGANFNPPDLRVVAGDVLDLFGGLSEFDGPNCSPSCKFGFCRTLPEMSGALKLRFEAGPVVPVVIDVTDLATYVGSRQWMGMLVTVKNVTLSEPPFLGGVNRYSIRIDAGQIAPNQEIPSITNEHFDLEALLPQDTMQGMVLSSVTGIVTYFFSPHIAPRNADDIVF